MEELISIIVPVYNTYPPFLEKCIGSLILQGYSNVEIIIVDDGSDTEIAQLCDELALRDKRIKVFHKNNGGVSSARNLGLKMSLGEYVTFVDSDDWVEDDFLTTLVSGVREESTDLSISGILYEYETNKTSLKDIKSERKTRYCYEKKEVYSAILHSKDIGGYLWNKLFRKELITNSIDEKLHYCEDFVFVATYAENIQKAIYINKKTYHYRQDIGNATGNYTYNSRILTLLDAYKKLKAIYARQCPKELSVIEKNLLKNALNLRARYIVCHSSVPKEYEIIKSTIKEYLWRVLKLQEISVAEKVNIILSWMFPSVIFQIKNGILGRKL